MVKEIKPKTKNTLIGQQFQIQNLIVLKALPQLGFMTLNISNEGWNRTKSF